MHLVTLREANIGLNYPCARCDKWFDTVAQQDKHHAEAHRLVWVG